VTSSTVISLLTLGETVVVIGHVSYSSEVLSLVELILLRRRLDLRIVVVIVVRLVLLAFIAETRLEVIQIVVLPNSCFGACLQHLVNEVRTTLLSLILLFLVVKVDCSIVVHLVFAMSGILGTI